MQRAAEAMDWKKLALHWQAIRRHCYCYCCAEVQVSMP